MAGKRYNSADEILSALQEIQKVKGYTYDRIAVLSGVNRSTVFRAFSGKISPSLDTVVKIAASMGYKLEVRQIRTASGG